MKRSNYGEIGEDDDNTNEEEKEEEEKKEERKRKTIRTNKAIDEEGDC